MATWEMYRPVNRGGNGAWVWATSEGEAARVFVAAGRARNLAGVIRCHLVDRPANLRVVDQATGADLGPLAELERTGTLAWAVSETDPHWLLQPIDLEEGAG